jgi:hypothetical protein
MWMMVKPPVGDFKDLSHFFNVLSLFFGSQGTSPGRNNPVLWRRQGPRTGANTTGHLPQKGLQ